MLVVTSLVTLVNIEGTSNPIQVSASTSFFSGRTISVDLSVEDYPVTATPAITVVTLGLGGDASHCSNNGNGQYELIPKTCTLL